MKRVVNVVIIFVTYLALLTLIFVQHRRLMAVQSRFDESIQLCMHDQEYIWSSFSVQKVATSYGVFSGYEDYLSTLSDSSIVVFLPSEICRSCFVSMLCVFSDSNVDYSNVCVVSERNDYQVFSECTSRHIQYVVSELFFDTIAPEEIVLFRKYCGFLPITMNYSVGKDNILSLFLSDNKSLLSHEKD